MGEKENQSSRNHFLFPEAFKIFAFVGALSLGVSGAAEIAPRPDGPVLGAKVSAEALPNQPSPQTEIGTAAVSHFLDCQDVSRYVIESVSTDKVVRINTPSIYSDTGSVSIDFSEPKEGQYVISMAGSDEDLTLTTADLLKSKDSMGFEQSIQVNDNMIMETHLFIDQTAGSPTIGQPFVNAECVAQAQFDKTHKQYDD